MKKLLVMVIVFLTLLAFGLAFAQQQKVEPPFEKAIEMALKGGVDRSTGSQCWKAEINKDGQKIVYEILYHKNSSYPDQIVLIKWIGLRGESICWRLDKEAFGKYKPETDWVRISRDEAIKLGFQFFRELVENRLI